MKSTYCDAISRLAITAALLALPFAWLSPAPALFAASLAVALAVLCEVWRNA